MNRYLCYQRHWAWWTEPAPTKPPADTTAESPETATGGFLGWI